jgi:hypothetical protein
MGCSQTKPANIPPASSQKPDALDASTHEPTTVTSANQSRQTASTSHSSPLFTKNRRVDKAAYKDFNPEEAKKNYG